MPPRNEKASATNDEVALLRDEVTDLKNQVRVLSDILDEIREELQWVTRNGLPIREPQPTVPVLKRMAADPCAKDWNERLVIENGSPVRIEALANSTPSKVRPVPYAVPDTPAQEKHPENANAQRVLF